MAHSNIPHKEGRRLRYEQLAERRKRKKEAVARKLARERREADEKIRVVREEGRFPKKKAKAKKGKKGKKRR